MVGRSFQREIVFEKQRWSDSTCKENFYEDFWLWRHPEEAGRVSERRTECKAWQRWRWTCQKLSRAGLFPGTYGFLWGLLEYALLGEGTDVYSEMGLACPASVHGRWLFWKIMPQVSDLIMSFTIPEITQGLQDDFWKNHLFGSNNHQLPRKDHLSHFLIPSSNQKLSL